MLDFLEWFLQSAWPWIIASIHLALTLGVSGHVVLTKRDPRAAMGWVGIIWLTPIVGTHAVSAVRHQPHSAQGPRPAPRIGQRDSSLGMRRVRDDVIQRVLGEESRAPGAADEFRRSADRLSRSSTATASRRCVGGQATYDAMLAAIDSAQHSVALQTYIFDNDPLRASVSSRRWPGPKTAAARCAC